MPKTSAWRGSIRPEAVRFDIAGWDEREAAKGAERLANRRAAPNDRRTWLIAITEKGRTEIDRALIIVRRVNEEIEQGFTDNEMEIFKKILNSFFAKFNQNGPATSTRSGPANPEG